MKAFEISFAELGRLLGRNLNEVSFAELGLTSPVSGLGRFAGLE